MTPIVTVDQPTTALAYALDDVPVFGRTARAHRGNVRILVTIARLLAHAGRDGVGAGPMTFDQVADRAGVAGSTARANMADLESRGLIVWHRGTPAVGNRGAVPGWVRVVKSAIVDLVASLSGVADATARVRRTERRAARGVRMSKIRDAQAFLAALAGKPRTRRRRPDQPPMKRDPLLRSSGGGAAGRPQDPWATCPHDAEIGRCGRCTHMLELADRFRIPD